MHVSTCKIKVSKKVENSQINQVALNTSIQYKTANQSTWRFHLTKADMFAMLIVNAGLTVCYNFPQFCSVRWIFCPRCCFQQVSLGSDCLMLPLLIHNTDWTSSMFCSHILLNEFYHYCLHIYIWALTIWKTCLLTSHFRCVPLHWKVSFNYLIDSST